MLNLETKNLINNLPKAELHLHIEGSLEPELMFKLAQKNNLALKYKNIAEVKAAYNFSNLQDFLDIYYAGASVLITEQDFYDMTWAYLEKAKAQNIVHCEIFFDPQTHTERGIPFATVVNGIDRALKDAQTKFNISSKLIMCFLRHLSQDSAMITLNQALVHKDKIIAVGLDSSEVGNPPSKFSEVFALARENGFLTVAHAGEEGPAEYVKQAIELLKVSRIDHGNNCLSDPDLVNEIVSKQIPLTVCPLSNYKLQVTPDLQLHPLRIMLEKGLLVTINSDDPAYFGGYLNENYLAIADALDLTADEIIKLATNSIQASFLDAESKTLLVKSIEQFKH
jgi:adenosine deaminase